MEPISSWILVGLITAEIQQELPVDNFYAQKNFISSGLGNRHLKKTKQKTAIAIAHRLL